MTWLDIPLIALDTETTSAAPETARVVTACIGMSMAPGQWSPMEWRVNPRVPIPAEATAIHGLTDADVADSPSGPDAMEPIWNRLAEVASIPIVGHNLAYDMTVLDREFRRHLGRGLPDELQCIDTLVLFRRFDLTTGGRRLEQLAARHGITFPAHDATADPLASLRLLHILAADNDLLPLVSVHDLQPLQAKWHAAHQTAAASKRLGNGQSADGFDTHWPMRPLTESEPA